ncbi:MAG: site-2 protease family protein [Ignavibacteriales bacterium]|nr:site-2 protease family protein [Ignavibacteriales bacterium]
MGFETTEGKNLTNPRRDLRILRFLLHGGLFILTFVTAAIAGVQWGGRNPFELRNISYGFEYAGAILFVLAAHEFGHYFAARYHRVNTTLPYFIPFPPLPFLLNFGTLGAVIRTRSVVPSKKVMFDIGVAGPIAGFVACLAIITYGFVTLPGPEYILNIHPEYDFASNAVPGSPGIPLEFGQTLLFKGMMQLFSDPANQFVPPMTEIYHYPLLCVGWFGLFVTAMNLIPIGQFDGGHIIYAMFGDKHRLIAKSAFIGLLVLGVPSVLESLLQPVFSRFADQPISQVIPFSEYSWSGWFLWALISYYFVKLYHPPVPEESPLDDSRMMVGWVAIGIFILCFSFIPFTIAL